VLNVALPQFSFYSFGLSVALVFDLINILSEKGIMIAATA
jgi:hypothetical protein